MPVLAEKFYGILPDEGHLAYTANPKRDYAREIGGLP